MAVQTTYSERMSPNSPGTIGGSDYDTVTGLCETAAPGGIPFGRAVGQGTLSDKGVVLGGSSTTFRGVSLKDATLGAEQDVYLPPNNVGVLTKGEIWVEPGVAVTPQDPVHFNASTGVFAISGGTGPIKGARWVTSCGIGGRALLYLSGYARFVT
jgi:hypothetical protein